MAHRKRRKKSRSSIHERTTSRTGIMQGMLRGFRHATGAEKRSSNRGRAVEWTITLLLVAAAVALFWRRFS